MSSQTFWTGFAAIVASIALGWQGYEHFRSEAHENERLHTDLRHIFSDLNDLAMQGSRPTGGSVGCGPDSEESPPCLAGECLGGLGLHSAYRDQYQLLTLQAEYTADIIAEELAPAEWLGLANACYISGYFDKCDAYLGKVRAQSEDDYILFRCSLIEAQVKFYRERPRTGDDSIKDAITIVKDNGSWTKSQRDIFEIQAKMSCAAMHATHGEKSAALECLRRVHTLLQSLPYTHLTKQLRNTLRDQVAAVVSEQKDGFGGKDFDAYVDEIKKVGADDSEDPPPTDAAPPAPTEAVDA